VSGGRWDIGPFLGYTEIVQTGDPLSQEDARIAWLGIHVGLGAPAQPPRADTDRDTVYDDEDACPREPGVRTRVASTNGCPRRDRDLDAIFDDEDACPREPGIRTNDPATNGCPRRDRDMDLVFDDEDACPDVRGVRTNDRRTNGCPQAAPAPARMVRLEQNHIVIEERIHFAFDRSEVREDSYGVIRAVAEFMTTHPAITLVEVEGHADERGSDAYNLALSTRRAEAVRALLVSFGVDPERLVARGLGEEKGSEEEAQRLNRRVEFTIVADPRLTSAHEAVGGDR
jgi:outer membrane protein OmpA-like peptidoglycan-associated protein